MRIGIGAIARGIRSRVAQGIQRRKVRSSIRPTDVFLVTYPKSGTIWLSYILAHALKLGPPEELNLRSLVEYVPDVNEIYFTHGSLHAYDALSNPRLFCLHAAYDRAFPKVVYMLRDPRDVAVSYWHFRKLTERDFKLTLRQFVEEDRHWPCSWEKHVAGWLLNHQHPNLLLVKYEEMAQDPLAVLTRMVGFLGVQVGEADLARAADASRFANMQTLETKFGVAGPEVVGEGRIVRRGRVGGWKEELDETSLRILEDKCSPVMDKVGYRRVT